MKLNFIEKSLMNNPIRALVQKHYEAAIMQNLGGNCEGKKVLEIGCGRGVGTEIIFERFGAAQIHAFDFDPKMVDIARQRLTKYPSEKLRLFVGDAENLDAPDSSFDAVFDFGVIHHIPNWQKSVSEVSRVLKRDGSFYFEEVTAKALNRWFYRTFLKHPKENRFTAEDFVGELERNEIFVGNRKHKWLFGDLIIGVGKQN